MAIQILNTPSFGATFGRELGAGIGSGLEALINQKQQQMQHREQRRQKVSGLQVLFGAEKAEQLANLPDPLLSEIIKGNIQLGLQGEKMQQSQQQLQQTQMQEEVIQNEISQEEALIESAATGEGGPADIVTPDITQDASPKRIAQELKNIPGQSLKSLEKSQSSEAKLKRKINAREKRLQNPKLSLKMRDRHKIEQRKDQEQLEKILEKRLSATKEVRSKLGKGRRERAEFRSVLERQLELNEGGNLNTPGYLGFLQNAGLDISALKTNDTQEFIKNNGVFFKKLKDLFGARITDKDIELFMKTIATTSQSPEARRRVLKSFIKMVDVEDAWAKAMDEVIEENEGIPPTNLESLAEKKVRPLLNKISKEFKADIKKIPLPPAESKFVTAGKIFAGKTLGAATRLVPAVAGAGLGFLIGGPTGAAVGGAIGGSGSLSKVLSSLGSK